MSGTPTVVLYGATGYVADLVLADPRARDLPIVLAGRPSARLDAVAARHRLPVHAAPVDRADELGALLDAPGVGHRAAVLVNLAGPFGVTASPLARACAERGVHYLDIAGEVDPFRAVAEHDALARGSGSVLLPGAGFGVVPTDCLAARVLAAAPAATGLRIGFATHGGVSRGTLATLAHDAPTRGHAVEHATLVRGPAELGRWRTGDRDLGTLVQNPWRGDLFTTLRHPGLRTVDCWYAVPAPIAALLDRSRRRGSTSAPLGFLARRAPVGPSARALRRGTSVVRVDARDDTGRVLASETIRLADAYVVTVECVLRLAQLLLDGTHPAGHATPSSLLGTEPLSWLER